MEASVDCPSSHLKERGNPFYNFLTVVLGVYYLLLNTAGYRFEIVPPSSFFIVPENDLKSCS